MSEPRVLCETGIELDNGETFIWRFYLHQEREALVTVGCVAADPTMPAFTYHHAAALCQQIRLESRRLRQAYGIAEAC